MTSERHVSTGSLPPSEEVRATISEAHGAFAPHDAGLPSATYPALAAVDPTLFGICVAGVSGSLFSVGDAATTFPIMSVAKPFTFALVCDAVGVDVAREHLGVDATGLPFDSVEAVERRRGQTNPMVNAGAIAAVGLLGVPAEEAWPKIQAGLSEFAGRELVLDDAVLRSAEETNLRNRAIALLMDAHGALGERPLALLDTYTRQSCLAVTANDLAVMGATLADGGVQPVTGRRVVSEASCRAALAVMATAGMYEHSGEWLYRVGLPGKSGIGGGLVAVAPGKGALGVFSPPLDAAGNTVRGQLVAERLSARLGLDLFASTPRQPDSD